MKFPATYKHEEKTLVKFGNRAFAGYYASYSNASELLAFFADKKKGKGIMKMNHNADRFDDYMNASNDRFAVGTFEEISEPKTNYGPYNEYINSLNKLPMWRKLQTNFATKMVRRRTRSEYDGELDYDKCYDIAPFTKRGMVPSSNKMIKLNVGMSFSANINGSVINQYGAFVSAIASLLENNGIGVELNIFGSSISGFMDASTKLSVQYIKVKRFDEYLSPQIMLQIFNSNFYRRVIFASKISTADEYGKRICHSLGQPLDAGVHWETKDGEIFIHSVDSINRQNECVEDILKFIEKI